MDNNSMNLVPHMENATTRIPEELIDGVLLRLPATSLCRFRCVSTSFRAFIEGMKLEDKTQRKLIFGEGTNQNNRATAFYVSSINGSLEQKILFRNRQKRQLFLCSDCKGLFLLSDVRSTFILWNPFTKQYKNLAACPLERGDHECRMGLGYDSASDDYKVVLVDPESTWIFGLRSNSWRRIDGEFRPDFGDAERWSFCAHFAHGHLYWLYQPFPYMHLDIGREILAFDVANEKFSQVMMPPGNPDADSISDFCIVKECLCVSYYYTAQKEVDLYLRNKDGDDYTWSRLCSIQLLSLDIEHFNYVKLVGYSEEGNKILLDIALLKPNKIEQKYMISYDLDEKFLSKVDFPTEEYALCLEPRTFNPSFVSITGAWKPLKEELYDEE